MNRTDEQIKADWSRLDTVHIDAALNHLRRHEQNIQEYLADCVAAICDVDVNEMLSNTDVIFLAHARWLYWYAYRYMTNESYEKISMNTSRFGHSFAMRSVQGGVNKMAMMIAEEPMWTKRWVIVRRIIKLRDQKDESKADDGIVIQVPRGMKDKLNITIKEK